MKYFPTLLRSLARLLILICLFPANACTHQDFNSPELSSEISLSFSVGIWPERYFSVYEPAGDRSFYAQIINNPKELREQYAKDGAREENLNYTSPYYTEEFFRDNALIFIAQNFPSTSIENQVHSLIRSGSTLIVDYTSKGPQVQVAEFQNWRVILEVKKSDIEGVTEIFPRKNARPMSDA